MCSPAVKFSLVGQRERVMATGGDHDRLDTDGHLHRRRDTFSREIAYTKLTVAITAKTVHLAFHSQ